MNGKGIPTLQLCLSSLKAETSLIKAKRRGKHRLYRETTSGTYYWGKVLLFLARCERSRLFITLEQKNHGLSRVPNEKQTVAAPL